MNFENDILNSVQALKHNGVLLYPTDTIWGLGCDASNESAIDKIFKIKHREKAKGFIVLMKDFEQLQAYVDVIPEKAINLISYFDKPLTIIYKSAKNLAPSCFYPDGSIAIRIPRDTFCNELLTQYGKPIVSTSANISNHKSPSFFNEIDGEVISSVDYCVQYRQEDSTPREASRIIRFNDKEDLIVVR